MKTIALSGKHKNLFTKVDDKIYPFVAAYKWFLSHKGYAFHMVQNNKAKNQILYLHHVILPLKDGLQTDHINRDKLDNRRQNLRLVNNSGNQQNTGKQKNNVAGYKNIKRVIYEYWQIKKTINGKTYSSKLYQNLKDAVKNRNKFLRDCAIDQKK